MIIMGTNFSFRNEQLYNGCKYFEDKYGIYIQKPEIHIAKTSAGWKPLFQANMLFKSVSEIKKFYEESGLDIFDEYNTKYTWEEFEARVLKFGADGKSHIQYNSEQDNMLSYYEKFNYHIDSDGYEFLSGQWD